MPGSQDYVADPRNARALIYLNGALVPREAARVSVFDAGFAVGDGVWEGVRLQDGVFLFLEAHIERLFAGAGAIALEFGMNREAVAAALYRTTEANGMTDGVHARIMVTRGEKATVNQDPRNALGRPTVVIVAEYKQPAVPEGGIALATSRIRCTPVDMFDMRLNSHSRLNLIRALLDIADSGADEAIMLDPAGHVSSCNATNLFVVVQGEVLTSTGEFCFHGITRGHVIELCHTHGVACAARNFGRETVSLAEEAFVTGTFGGITPVGRIDGRELPACPGPVTRRVAALYQELKRDYVRAHRL